MFLMFNTSIAAAYEPAKRSAHAEKRAATNAGT